jgi:CRP-like cAMP-binding protein
MEAMADAQTPQTAVTAVTWRRNWLLAAMPEGELTDLAAELELVDLQLRDPLYDMDQPIEHVYFPLDGVMSMVTLVDDGTVIEVATIGAEGMVGLPAFLGATTSPTRVFCQIPGQAARLEVEALRRFTTGNGALHNVLNRYTQSMMTFLARNVACNRAHSTAERCARWLAQTHDRVGRDNFTLTQEFLAQMLGVRRPTVSLSARVLQQAGLIRYTRGCITILDRDGLHAAACECYDIVRGEFNQST